MRTDLVHLVQRFSTKRSTHPQRKEALGWVMCACVCVLHWGTSTFLWSNWLWKHIYWTGSGILQNHYPYYGIFVLGLKTCLRTFKQVEVWEVWILYLISSLFSTDIVSLLEVQNPNILFSTCASSKKVDTLKIMFLQRSFFVKSILNLWH